MPMISVIVPVYNVEKYIHRCVDSILGQTYTDFELILVDDGSPDNCGSICDQYAAEDARVVVIHQNNSGVAAARNAALEIACGDFIAFCDSDDYYGANFLSSMSCVMEAEQADVVVSGYIPVTDEMTEIKHSKIQPGINHLSTPYDRIRYNIDVLCYKMYGWEVWTRIFRNDIIQKNNIRFVDTFAEDMCFVLEYSLFAGKIVSIPKHYYHYYIRDNSIMRTTRNELRLDDMLKICLHMEKRFCELFPNDAAIKSIPILHFLIMYNQYSKIIGTSQYSQLKQHTRLISNHKAWRTITRRIFRCYKELANIFGKKNAQRVLLFANYCLHGNWKRFTIESSIAYRWFIK